MSNFVKKRKINKDNKNFKIRNYNICYLCDFKYFKHIIKGVEKF